MAALGSAWRRKSRLCKYAHLYILRLIRKAFVHHLVCDTNMSWVTKMSPSDSSLPRSERVSLGENVYTGGNRCKSASKYKTSLSPALTTAGAGRITIFRRQLVQLAQASTACSPSKSIQGAHTKPVSVAPKGISQQMMHS